MVERYTAKSPYLIPHQNFWLYSNTCTNLLTLLVAPTTLLSPSKTSVSRFLDGQRTPRLRKKQISFSEEDEVLRDVAESPFDTGSVYSAPSMLSIHSEVGTSKHEDDVS